MDNIVNKHRNKYNRDWIFYEQNIIGYSKLSERNFIIDAILEEFPDYQRDDIQLAVSYVCNTITPPCSTETFLFWVHSLLKKRETL